MITKYAVVFALIVIASDLKVITTESLNNKLALIALKSREKQSMVVSTLAIKLPLCKLASVADDETKTELMTALGFTSNSMIKDYYVHMKEKLRVVKDSDLLLIDKLYLDVKHDIDPKFLRNSQEDYGVQIEKIGYDSPIAAAAYVNRVVSIQTYQRIQDLLDSGDLNKDTSMIIVTAAHYKASWEQSFDIGKTKIEKFMTLKNTVTLVPMMSIAQEHMFMTDEQLGFQQLMKALTCSWIHFTNLVLIMITMLLFSYATSISFVVPTRGDGLPELLRKMEMQPDLLQKARDKMTFEYVNIKIPKLSLKTCIDFSEYLKEVGVRRIFNTTASGLDDILTDKSQTKNVHLSKIKQKNFIEIDEYGIHFPKNKDEFQHNRDYFEMAVDRGRMPGTKEFSLTANRPFLFFINIHGALSTTSDTGNEDITDELFTGVYYGPE